MTIQTYCPNCGAALVAGAQFCPSCGARISAMPAGTTTGQCPHCGAAGQDGVFCRNCDRFMPDPSGTVEKVTFNRRFWGTYLLEALLFVVTLIIGWFIWLFFTAKTSQSPAKRLLNVYVLDLTDGYTVAAGRVWVRDALVKQILFNGIIGNLTFGIGWLVNSIWILFDKNRQALHDKVVNTVVVYAPRGLPEALKRREL